jgi:hypothetical protein
MVECVETLEAQLAEKEQLVAALTERLEQAAEQLDRLHRTGADRGLRAGVAGVPAELIQQQQKLVDDLQRAVQQWEDMQPGAFFGRLESQLSRIQEIVENPEPSERRSSSTGMGYGDFGQRGRSEREEDQPPQQESPRSLLDFMKSAVQKETREEEPSTAPTVDSAFTPAPTASDAALPPLRDPPDEVNFANATRDELALACQSRDSYILYLLERLRQASSRGHVPNSWADLADMPGELRVRLETLEKRLEEAQRLSEVELSLQRAKLARDEARLHTMDEQVQKELKRARDASDVSGANDAQGSSGGRWKRMLGRRPNETG